MQHSDAYQMVKAAEEQSHYAYVREQMDKGNKQILSQMSTTSPGEYGWGLIGAGLGAGGGYLVSRALRPKATKRQRALDILIGAALGGAGSLATMHSLVDDSGFTFAERMRADQNVPMKNPNAHSNGSLSQSEMDTQEALQAIRKGMLMAGGGVVGATAGGVLGPVEGTLEGLSTRKLMGKLELDAAKSWNKYVKQHGLKAPTEADKLKYIENYKAVGASKSMGPKRMARFGRAIDIIGGGILGAIGGNYLDKYYGEKIMSTTGGAA